MAASFEINPTHKHPHLWTLVPQGVESHVGAQVAPHSRHLPVPRHCCAVPCWDHAHAGTRLHARQKSDTRPRHCRVTTQRTCITHTWICTHGSGWSVNSCVATLRPYSPAACCILMQSLRITVLGLVCVHATNCCMRTSNTNTGLHAAQRRLATVPTCCHVCRVHHLVWALWSMPVVNPAAYVCTSNNPHPGPS